MKGRALRMPDGLPGPDFHGDAPLCVFLNSLARRLGPSRTPHVKSLARRTGVGRNFSWILIINDSNNKLTFSMSIKECSPTISGRRCTKVLWRNEKVYIHKGFLDSFEGRPLGSPCFGQSFESESSASSGIREIRANRCRRPRAAFPRCGGSPRVVENVVRCNGCDRRYSFQPLGHGVAL